MYQLKYDEAYENIVRDISHWTNEQDIPNNIIEYMKENSNNRTIYEENSGLYYCAKCLNQLDENNYCHICNKQHTKYSMKDYPYKKKDVTIIDTNIKQNKFDIEYICRYLLFYKKEQSIYLYSVNEIISYKDPFYFKPIKHSNIKIDLDSSYYVEEGGLTNLKTDKYISFKKLSKIIEQLNNKKRNIKFYYEKKDKNLQDLIDRFCEPKCCYIYTNNLEELKNTFYKYTFLWNQKNYLEKVDTISINSLTTYPLFYPQFEFLIKFKLYNLAFYSTPFFVRGRNFKEIFGIDKNFLPSMVENNITYVQLKVMRELLLTDIESINFFGDILTDCDDVLDSIKEFNIDVTKLMKCFTKNNLESDYIWEYLDYCYMAKELKLDLKDNKILYPNNLLHAHDDLYTQIQIMEDPSIDSKIKRISDIVSLNSYEDDNYKIYPANSIADLVDESSQQNNCVRTYCTYIANNECQVYFMRKKEDLKKSFITIEVRNNKITQARLKYNKLPDSKINKLLNNWEKQLIYFDFSK